MAAVVVVKAEAMPPAPQPAAPAMLPPRYTLSEEQERAYFFDGFLLIPGFFTATEVAAMQQAAAELEEDAAAGGCRFPGCEVKRMEVQEGGRRLPHRLENFASSCPALGAAVVPRLEALVGQLFCDDGRAAHLYKEKIVYKRRGGAGYAPHYDGPSVAQPGLARDFITAQVALDDQTPLNGCLQGVWPRHQCPEPEDALVPATVGGNPDLDGRAGAIADATADQLPWRDMPSLAGDVLLFNHFFPHRSQRNNSAATRRTAFYLLNPALQGDQHAAHRAHSRAARAQWQQRAVDDAADVQCALLAGVALSSSP